MTPITRLTLELYFNPETVDTDKRVTVGAHYSLQKDLSDKSKESAYRVVEWMCDQLGINPPPKEMFMRVAEGVLTRADQIDNTGVPDIFFGQQQKGDC